MEHMKNKKNEPENKKAVKEKLKKEQIKEENESFENKEEQKSNKIIYNVQPRGFNNMPDGI